MPTICLTGAMPLAILSISSAGLNSCFNSVYATGILEIILSIVFIFIPTKVKNKFDILGISTLKKNLSLVFYSGLWCFIFAFWAVVHHQQSFDYILSNTNPDMWAYVRRFAAMTTDNLNFYGGRDSFVFNGNSACAFLLGSPKKFSSFLGSLIVYFFKGSSLGIAIFQGMLGGILFICLFKEWFDIRLSDKKRSWLGKIILITWALFSPSIYWLLVNSYLSNTLFIIVVCLTVRQARTMTINSNINTIENFVCLGSILTIVLSFYPAFVPIILSVNLITILIYLPLENFNQPTLIKIIIKFTGVILGIGLIFYILFPTQLGLNEIQKSFSILNKHGSNFVPLNPWSLLQEKPKPMASIRDFGWHINIIVGLLFSLFVGWKIIQKYQKNKNYLESRNLIAGLVGLGLYSAYLLAFIPLEYTYRLMKIAISLIYPLTIFGLLPFILWSKNQLQRKSFWIRNIVFILAIAHTVFHIYKVFDINYYGSGKFILSNPSKLENIPSIEIVGCENTHASQFYERLVGLQIAMGYPNSEVHVVSYPKDRDIDNIPDAQISIRGNIIPHGRGNKKTCHFSI